MFEYAFMQNAFIVALLISIVCPLFVFASSSFSDFWFLLLDEALFITTL